MGARGLISGTRSKRLTGGSGVEDVGKQTRSDPMETVRPGKSRSDSPEVSSREIQKIILSHEAKQERCTCNRRCSLSDDPKQARNTCNIRRSLSHDAKQARYTCNIRRSLTRDAKKTALHM